MPLDKLSKAVIMLERTTLVVFSSLGRRDMPLVSVATVSLAVRTTLCSKISRVVLFVEKISSACIKSGLTTTCHKSLAMHQVYYVEMSLCLDWM